MSRPIKTVFMSDAQTVHVAVMADGHFLFSSKRMGKRTGRLEDVFPDHQRELAPLSGKTPTGTLCRTTSIKLGLWPAALPDLESFSHVNRMDAIRAHSWLLGAFAGIDLTLDVVPFSIVLPAGVGMTVFAVGSSHPGVLAGRFGRIVMPATDPNERERVALAVADDGLDLTEVAAAQPAEAWLPSGADWAARLAAPQVPGAEGDSDRVLCTFELLLEVVWEVVSVLDGRYKPNRGDIAEWTPLTDEQQKYVDNIVQMVKRKRLEGRHDDSFLNQAIGYEEWGATEAGIPLWQLREMVRAEVNQMPVWRARVGTDLTGTPLYARGLYQSADHFAVTNDPKRAMPYYVEEQAAKCAAIIGGVAEPVT